MNIQRVKQGAKITFYTGVYMIVLGIFFIFFIDLNMRYAFSSTTKLWGFFLKYNWDVSYLFYLFNILTGILLISNGITISYLSDFIMKRKEKITWVMLFIIGITSWAGLLTVSVLFQSIILIALSFIGWLVFIIGMLIPISYYIEKPYREY
ncbi:MAG: hypothetical protein WC979_05935 [Candidatus Pacearchaeota archaeon]|jgi:hypothetical protein